MASRLQTSESDKGLPGERDRRRLRPDIAAWLRRDRQDIKKGEAMIQSRPNEFRADERATVEPGSELKGRLKQHSDDVCRMADEVGHSVTEATREAGETLRQKGHELAEQARQSAREVGHEAQERASTMVAHQKSRLADEVGVFAEALHKAAETLEQNDDPMLGRYAHQAGAFCDSCARYLRDTDPRDMIRGVSNFTRRHPELVLGGLFLAGIGLARFLKASDRMSADFKASDRMSADFDRSEEFDRPYGGLETGRRLESGLTYGDRETFTDRGYGDIGMYADSDVEPYGMSEPLGMGEEEFSDIDISDEMSGMAPLSREERGQRGDADQVPDFPREEASLTRNTDLPEATSPQPGSYPPATPSGTIFTGTANEAGKVNPTATQDDDLNTIGRNEPSGDHPNKPR
jgi:gas vesicle protein